ncbi:MAG TPA: TetR/AcrR family transcriptional regulator [Clostridia bacterium]|nr:TetR/AcrR family transcriptional regulator [Clostridia bacterium]
MKELFSKIREEKRSRILTAATNEFAKNGFEHTNVNEIAKNAEVSVGSLYKYFDSKQDIFLTTVRYCASILKTILDKVMKDDDDWQVKVEKIIRVIQVHSRENKVIIQLYNEMATQSNSGIVIETVAEVESLSAELYSGLIEREQKKGGIRSDCDSRMFAFFLDNLFMMLQFSYACDYYRERFKVFVSSDILQRDNFVAEQMLKFMRGAFAAEHSEEKSNSRE